MKNPEKEVEIAKSPPQEERKKKRSKKPQMHKRVEQIRVSYRNIIYIRILHKNIIEFCLNLNFSDSQRKLWHMRGSDGGETTSAWHSAIVYPQRRPARILRAE